MPKNTEDQDLTSAIESAVAGEVEPEEDFSTDGDSVELAPPKPVDVDRIGEDDTIPAGSLVEASDSTDEMSREELVATIQELRKQVDEIDSVTAEDSPGQKVVHTRKIDTFNAKRTVRVAGPAVCEECGFDFCEANELGPYEKCRPEIQDDVRAGMQRHRRLHDKTLQDLDAEKSQREYLTQ